jgi:uncharacterized protein (TIGR00369 family)
MTPRLAAGDASGLDRALRRVAGEVPLSAVHETFGIRLVEASPGRASARCDVSPWLADATGLLASGAAAVVADIALGSAALTTMDAGYASTTVQLRLDHLRAVEPTATAFTASAAVDHSARGSLLVHGEVLDDAGQRVARTSARCLMVAGSGEQAEAPAVPGRRVTDPGGAAALAGWLAARGGPAAAPRAYPPVVELLSIRAAAEGSGRFLVTAPASGSLANAFGGLMGGALTLLVEQALTLTALDAVGAGYSVRPVDLHVTFLRQAVADGSLLGSATRVVRCGRRIVDVAADVTDARGRLVATARGACLRLSDL